MTQLEKAIRMYDEVVLVDVNSFKLNHMEAREDIDQAQIDKFVAQRLMMSGVKEVLVCRIGSSVELFNRRD